MTILIFILSGFASFLLATAIRLKDDQLRGNIAIAIIIGVTCSLTGTYRGCEDGWMSTSIGKNGACSSHGGVSTFINIYGVSIILLSALMILFLFLWKPKKK